MFITQKEHPSVFIIVLNWNGKDDTLECLASVKQIDYPNFTVIVADNGSSDDSVIAIQAAHPDVFILENGANLGFAEGNNRAISYALSQGADAVLILNNDTIVDPNLLQAFVAAYNTLPQAGILGTVSFYYDKPEIIWAAGGEWDSNSLELKHICCGEHETRLPSHKPYAVNYAVGCALFVHKSVIDKIGLMEPLFFLNFEENDWCQRANKAGLINYTVPDAKIWHKVSSSFGGESPLWKYYMTRNLLIWSKRHLPAEQHRAVIKKTVRELFPLVSFIRPTKAMTVKQRYWALFAWCKELKRRLRSSFYKAQFSGILHYFIHRYGPCPAALQKKLNP